MFFTLMQVGCKKKPHVENPPLKAGLLFGDHYFQCSTGSTPLDLIEANRGALRIIITGTVSPQFQRTYLFYPGQTVPINYTVSGNLHLPAASPSINNPCISNLEIPYQSGFSIQIQFSENKFSPCEGNNCFRYYHNEDFLSRNTNWNQNCNPPHTYLQPANPFVSFCL